MDSINQQRRKEQSILSYSSSESQNRSSMGDSGSLMPKTDIEEQSPTKRIRRRRKRKKETMWQGFKVIVSRKMFLFPMLAISVLYFVINGI